MTDEHDRPDPPRTGDESSTLDGFVEHLRATLAWKTADLDDEQLAATLPPSDLTLGGMLHHLAYVEDYWFGVVVAGREPTPPWDTVDWDADNDWEWHVAPELGGDVVRARWDEAVRRSREALRDQLATARPFESGAMGRAFQTRGGSSVSLRYVLTHVATEYARHLGHVDLLRESIDGLVGD